MPEEVTLQVIFPRLSTRERALFGVGLVNNTYIIRYHISTIDMSENRRIVHPYNKKTVNQKGAEKCGKNLCVVSGSH